MGGRVYCCAQCKEHDYAYYSCHNRACPKCGAADNEKWAAAQEEKLLPVPYFLWTFTVPQALHPAFKNEPKLLQDLLFNLSFEALQAVADRPEVLGGKLGAVAVLHTWGRQMQYHPHVHMIVPGGGLHPHKEQWMRAKEEWMAPVKAVIAHFRKSFERQLQERAPGLHAQIAQAVWRGHWNVDVQPVGNGLSAVRYLARYVKRTAISQERILEANDKFVRFQYEDSATEQTKEMTLSATEFMRRYLSHVPLPGQHRIRYFGWMHPAAFLRRMTIEGLLKKVIVVRQRAPAVDWSRQCPHCNKPTLICIAILPRGPPIR